MCEKPEDQVVVCLHPRTTRFSNRTFVRKKKGIDETKRKNEREIEHEPDFN